MKNVLGSTLRVISDEKHCKEVAQLTFLKVKTNPNSGIKDPQIYIKTKGNRFNIYLQTNGYDLLVNLLIVPIVNCPQLVLQQLYHFYLLKL